MAKCKDCGKEHGIVLKNKQTGECIPVDWCEDCIYRDCRYVKEEPADCKNQIETVCLETIIIK